MMQVYPQLGKFLSFVLQLLKNDYRHTNYEYSRAYLYIIFEDILYRYTFADNGMIVDPNEINDEPLTEILRNEMLIGEIQKREALWNILKFLLPKGTGILFRNCGRR